MGESLDKIVPLVYGCSFVAGAAVREGSPALAPAKEQGEGGPVRRFSFQVQKRTSTGGPGVQACVTPATASCLRTHLVTSVVQSLKTCLASDTTSPRTISSDTGCPPAGVMSYSPLGLFRGEGGASRGRHELYVIH